MKNLFYIFLTFIILSFQSFSQEIVFPAKDDSESFAKLEDGIIKREIATFNLASTFSEQTTDSLPKPELIEISLRHCDSDGISFERGNWISANLHVSIDSEPFITEGHDIEYLDSAKQWIEKIDGMDVWGTDGTLPKKRMIAPDYWFHIHWPLSFPESAVDGLYEPNFCSSDYCYKDKTEPEKVYCSVYQSKDKKRVYVYMLNGDGAGAYEVTWIIENQKYLRRVIDYAF